VLAGSVPFVLMPLVTLPGAWKFASRAFPDAVQDSPFVEAMLPLVAAPAALGALGVPFPVVAAMVALFDVACTVLGLAGLHLQLVSTAAALALGVHAFKRAVRVTDSTVAAA
jgi:hypothetical protein